MNQGASPPGQSSMIKAQRSRPPATNNKKWWEPFLSTQKPPPFEKHRRSPGDSAQKRPKSTEMLGCPPDLSSLWRCENDLMRKKWRVYDCPRVQLPHLHVISYQNGHKEPCQWVPLFNCCLRPLVGQTAMP